MENTNKIKLLSISRTVLSRSFWRLSHGAWRRQEKLWKLYFLLSQCPLLPPFVPKSAIVIFNINLPQLSVFWCFSKSRFISSPYSVWGHGTPHPPNSAPAPGRDWGLSWDPGERRLREHSGTFPPFLSENITPWMNIFRYGILILRRVHACLNLQNL